MHFEIVPFKEHFNKDKAFFICKRVTMASESFLKGDVRLQFLTPCFKYMVTLVYIWPQVYISLSLFLSLSLDTWAEALHESLEKQKKEYDIMAEAKVFRETDKIRSQFDLEKREWWASYLTDCIAN